MSNIGLLCFTELIIAVCMCGGGAIKIGARPFWCRGVFVLVISNVNIGYQKSLTPPLKPHKVARILCAIQFIIVAAYLLLVCLIAVTNAGLIMISICCSIALS